VAEIHRIKRYANRKLYDTTTSCYVSLEKIHELIKQGVDVEIVDSRTGEDITSVTLAQVMVEVEKSHKSLLPLEALKNLLSGGEGLMEFMGQVRKAGIGAASIMSEEAGKTYRRIIERGELSEEEAKDYLEELGDTTSKQVRDLEKGVDKRVKDFVDSMRVPSQAEIHRLHDKLDGLIAKVDAALANGTSGTSKHKAKARTRAAQPAKEASSGN